MGKIEDVLRKKFKQSLYSAKRDDLIEFADYMFEKLWKMSKERQRLIEDMEIAGVAWTPKTAPKKRAVKQKAEPKPKPKPKPKPEPKKAKPKPKPKPKKKRVVRQKELSDGEIASLIAKELADEPEEIIEVAEPPKEPTANVEREPEPLPELKPRIKSEEQTEIDEMMK